MSRPCHPISRNRQEQTDKRDNGRRKGQERGRSRRRSNRGERHSGWDPCIALLSGQMAKGFQNTLLLGQRCHQGVLTELLTDLPYAWNPGGLHRGLIDAAPV